MTPFKISVLVFLRDGRGRQLLIKRSKAPNLGCWSPIGGKLEMERGESPFECAIRETKEEVGLALTETDLHLFAYISEKNYEGGAHWLMFMFDCKKVLPGIPPDGDEGKFGLFTREEIDDLAVPSTDLVLVWPWYDKYRGGFVCLRANCAPGEALEVVVEQTMTVKQSRTPFDLV